jgi:hypothetical protein
MEQQHMLNEVQVSQYLNRTVASLRSDRILHRGLPYYKIGAQVRYKFSDVEEFLRQCRVEPRARVRERAEIAGVVA